MSATHGVAIIGSGTVADLHVKALRRHGGNVALRGVFSLDLNQASHKAQQWACRTYSTLNELLSDEEVEIVIIASPVEAHFDQATAALTAGKHVLVEKPVALHSDEVAQLVRTAKTCGKVCAPGHNYVYDYEIQRMKDFIASGQAGAVASFWMIYNLAHPLSVLELYPGALRQIMTHHLSVALYLFGAPAWISANVSKIRAAKKEEQAVITLEYENGLLANLFSSMAVDDETSTPWSVIFKVLGTEGGATFSWRDYVRREQSSNLGLGYYLYEDSFYQEQAQFLQHLEHPEAGRLRSTLHDAMLVAYALELAEQAVQTRAAQPFLPYQ
ncbi:Gfo/Idh/MocA family protein [Alicyclobacillus fodiniaquatilis]|uniref:Gfo/Idh/MocA family protein n=1 Tax=Alicyclobacillus fodiniaquatilis TaxID=1661150 RepID=A0ABW4JHR9_9BACL